MPTDETGRLGRRWYIVALIAACVLVQAPAPAHAQGVEGTVQNRETGQALAGVLVSLTDPDGSRQRAVLSDAAGHFEVGAPPGRYYLIAERIGLDMATTDTFVVAPSAFVSRTIEMTERAVELAGVVVAVDPRVEPCEGDREQAVEIQRWWSAARMALRNSAALQDEQIGLFLIESYEQEWDGDLGEVLGRRRTLDVRETSRPFATEAAESLVRDGFVRGAYGIDRTYFGPDADVILSNVFLIRHCFSLVRSDDRPDELGLRFEPAGTQDVADVAGTLWVDTTSSELSHLDFRFVNLDGPDDEVAGGRIGFELLGTGAWIVSEWYMRTPLTGIRGSRRRLAVTGYFEGGAAMTPLELPEASGRTGSLVGRVADRLRGSGLPGATVSVLGTEWRTMTDGEGRFRLSNLPVGAYRVTYSHPEVALWGIDETYVSVVVRDGATSRVELEIPDFASLAPAVCLGDGTGAETVIVGRLVASGGEPMHEMRTQLRYENTTSTGGDLVWLEFLTDEEGRFASCSVPADRSVTLRVRVDQHWLDVATFFARQGELTYHEWIVPPPR